MAPIRVGATQVVPVRGSLKIEELSPDLNGDGVVEDWERQVFEKFKAADKDGDGELSQPELYGAIKEMSQMMSAMTDAAKKGGGIPIHTLNPDADGDGRVEKSEAEIFDRIKAADADESGIISIKELFNVIKGAAQTEKQKKFYRKAALGLTGVVAILIAALVAISVVGAVVGGNMIKESHVIQCGATDQGCEPTDVVRTGGVESFTPSVFVLASAPTEQLSFMRDVTMYVDMRTSAEVASVVQATFKIAGAYKPTPTVAYLQTTAGGTIRLDSTSQTGRITMDGATYPVLETLPVASTAGRHLDVAGSPLMLDTLAQWELFDDYKEKRRKLSSDMPSLVISGAFAEIGPQSHESRRLWGGYSGGDWIHSKTKGNSQQSAHIWGLH